MSSNYVVNEITNFIATEIPSESNVLDLTGIYDEIQKALKGIGVTGQMPWLGLQFIGSSEEPVSLSADNSSGKYREEGAIYLHVVEKSALAVTAKIRARAELIRNTFRGQRIGDILIESVSPPNFETGATLQFEGGYTSAAIVIGYERDLNL